MAWSPKRIAALILASLLGSGALGCLLGSGNVQLAGLLIFGAVLGVIYVFNDARLPESLIKSSGGRLSDDDDPSNIPARVYLPLILILLAAAGTAVWIVTRK